MFRAKLLVLIPLLTLVIPVLGMWHVSASWLAESREAAENDLRSASARVPDSSRAVLEEALGNAESLEDPVGALYKSGPDSTKDSGPDLYELQRTLRQLAQASQGTKFILLDAQGDVVAQHPQDGPAGAVCAIREARNPVRISSDWAAFGDVGGLLYTISHVKTGGGQGLDLCIAVPADDRVLGFMKRRVGPELAVFSGDWVLASTIASTRPEVAAGLIQKKAGIYTFGEPPRSESPIFGKAPGFISLVVPSALPAVGGNFSVALVVPFSSISSSIAGTEWRALLLIIGCFLTVSVFSMGAYLSTSRALAAMGGALLSVTRGNLQAQVPASSMEHPFRGVADLINRALFVVRERAAGFSARRHAEGDGSLQAPHGAPNLKPGAAAPQPEPVHDSEILPPDYNDSPEMNPALFFPNAHSGVVPVKNIEMEEPEELLKEPADEESGSDPFGSGPARLSTVAVNVPQDLWDNSRLDVYESVFNEFLQARLKHGEGVENLTRERFIEKLKRTRDEVMAKTGAADAKFLVVVKDGRATIKVTPVK